MNYKIDIWLLDHQPPFQADDETDSEFESRLRLWETELKDKSFWRAMMIDGVDSDITRQHRMAVESASFHKSEDGSKELQILMEMTGIALSRRQASKKRIAESAEVE